MTTNTGPKWVYNFGAGQADGRAEMRALLGGKGANLAEMSNLGLPVPPGFTITTEVCTYFYKNGETYPPDLKAAVEAALRAHGHPRLIHGHTHRPAHHTHCVDGHTCERWVLADWYQRGSYLRCDAGGCTMVQLPCGLASPE